MIRKSGTRFSEKIMLKRKLERDDDSKKSHLATGAGVRAFGQLDKTALASGAALCSYSPTTKCLTPSLVPAPPEQTAGLSNVEFAPASRCGPTADRDS